MWNVPQFKIMMTIEQFEQIPAGEVFRKGEIKDDATGYNATGSGKMLKFVAVKGGSGFDWAIYVGWSDWGYERIREGGDKVRGEKNITNIVGCTPAVLARYRR